MASSARFKAEFQETHPLRPGGRVAVETMNGSIEVNGWDRDEVEITGTRYASSEDLLAALKIDVVATDGFVQVRTVRPSGRRGNMGASFVLHVPRLVLLDRLEASNGAITIKDIEGDVRLKTSNGRISIEEVKGTVEADTSNGGVTLANSSGPAKVKTSNGNIKADGVYGYLDAKTSNGSIKARMLKVDSSRPIQMRSSNGGIELTIDEALTADIIASTSNASITVRAPDSLAAKIKASTSNGSIKTDFDVEGTIKKSMVEGVISGGGPLLDLGTSNGSIRLLKGTPEV
jgi:DUF4097 and DUF4098 domain-containing protein YvlB